MSESTFKVGLYDPYLDSLGGGEAYILSIGECLSKNSPVSIFWNDSSVISKAEDRFGINLEKMHVVPNVFNKKNALAKALTTRRYNAIFYVSDGSIPLLFSKNNNIIFQFPVPWEHRSFVTSIKLKNIKNFLCYSNFVKRYIDKEFKINSLVLPPPVHIEKKNVKKEKIILTVGRFTKAMNTKKQEVLIEAFKDMMDHGLKDWKLLIVGSFRDEDEDYFNEISEKSSGYPIEVMGNISHDEIVNLYNRSKIYWHAAGYGEDLENHPERAEHFGISTVEAMCVGTVPVVINAGGQKEIMVGGQNGFLWDTLSELEKKTTLLVEDEKTWEKMSEKAMSSAKNYSREKFCERVLEIAKI